MARGHADPGAGLGERGQSTRADRTSRDMDQRESRVRPLLVPRVWLARHRVEWTGPAIPQTHWPSPLGDDRRTHVGSWRGLAHSIGPPGSPLVTGALECGEWCLLGARCQLRRGSASCSHHGARTERYSPNGYQCDPPLRIRLYSRWLARSLQPPRLGPFPAPHLLLER